MKPNKVVSREEWISARTAFLAKEKELTRLRDQVSAARRELPWVKVDKDYVFEGPGGKASLPELFEGRSQLIVVHFMFGPSWEQGCPSCSFMADSYDNDVVHLNHRDVSLAVVSRAPLSKLDAYKKRMGWRFTWFSSLGSDFNFDYQVSFAPDATEKYYNYKKGSFPMEEAPGVSVFAKSDEGEVFHTYSTYGRGLDCLIGTYPFLDLVPKGRDEKGLSYPMAWVRRHDQYED